ncbi:MAG TPA: hypothetical protein PLM56_17045 [Cyclobacteriaceae bacterium]|jgi:hypothetical protein|nr:hypothetical protein [Cytophagales bacterium]HNT50967.1 hypothetical protein [Cyclobacteriaceae bacterium]HRE65340.1 hypothetical protein [Cyclobacteriaceae bacterium]HRF35215.1 hypothetical protein [Cyclobacteriaceae bacterium]
MAFIYDIVFNKMTNRHEMDFVNQQYDYLMSIRFVDTTHAYELNVSQEKANEISRYWSGRDFEMEYWLNLANEELPRRDKEVNQN